MAKKLHPGAGKPAPVEELVNVPRLVRTYYSDHPDPGDESHAVSFGTSGHRGSSLKRSFNEDHILATTQAICDYRRKQGIDGPLFIGLDTHALSEPAFASALEVLAANGITAMIDAELGFTPTPVISHAILGYNRDRRSHLADGIVVTPSHNPPTDGGFKYNPPSGGPADTGVTRIIQDRANELLAAKLAGVERISFEKALSASTTKRFDYRGSYVKDLGSVIDLAAIRDAGLRIGVDPLGGSGIAYWEPIAETWGLDIDIVDKSIDGRFAFMPLDHDGKIRMDCSSPHAMARLIEMRDRYDVAFGNDTDYDRHGIVVAEAGLIPPNHYLSAAIYYLFQNRSEWKESVAIGKTVVSSSMIDRVGAKLGRRLVEVPVGFKWFVDGLAAGTLGFGGEESAGASFLRRDGSVWSTDKDGIIMDLLAAEILARSGESPAALYRALCDELGTPHYERIDTPASAEQKRALAKLDPKSVRAEKLAGDPISACMSNAPGNDAAIGGLKVATEQGWFAARPSGTEDIYKLYAESFRSADHLAQIQTEAQQLIEETLA